MKYEIVSFKGSYIVYKIGEKKPVFSVWQKKAIAERIKRKLESLGK